MFDPSEIRGLSEQLVNTLALQELDIKHLQMDVRCTKERISHTERRLEMEIVSMVLRVKQLVWGFSILWLALLILIICK